MTQPTNKARVLIGVRGMDKEAGERISTVLLGMPGVTQAQPDQGTDRRAVRPHRPHGDGSAAGHSQTGLFGRACCEPADLRP